MNAHILAILIGVGISGAIVGWGTFHQQPSEAKPEPNTAVINVPVKRFVDCKYKAETEYNLAIEEAGQTLGIVTGMQRIDIDNDVWYEIEQKKSRAMATCYTEQGMEGSPWISAK